MMKIEVNTTTATLIPPRESLTPGAVNAVQLEFTFSDEWNGLTKTCVFSNEIETVPAELQNDITSVPTEVLDEVYRWISVGVSGEDAEGTVIIPTIWCRIGQCIPGASGRFVTIDMLQAYWSKQEIDLHTEGDGTKFLGDDGVYHYVSQGGGDVTHEELDAALALKADKDAFDALSATVDDKADKSEIITVTTGDGTKYLADDGTYKTIQGGGDVTHEELDAAIAPLATKDELSTAVEPLATKTELDSAVAGLATTAAMNAALALKADKTELASYAKQYDVNQALATKADKTETQTALAQKADKSEIITVTTGSGTLFLADDGTYKPAAGDPPDLSAYLTKTEAGTTYTTITYAEATYATKEDVTIADNELQEAIDLKADASALADYETTAHASATYATKAELPDVSDMLTKTEAGETYATKTELADKADSATVTALSGVVTGHTASISALETGKADKSEIPVVDSTLIPDSPNPVSNAAVVTGFATYGTQMEQLNAQVVANAEAIEGLESSKADRTQLQGYLTKMEASETYETIARASKIKSITAAGHAVTVTDEGLVNVGGTKVSRATETPQIGVSNVSIAVQQILPATEEATTGEGETLPIAYTSTTSGALTEYSNFTIDGVQIATKDDLTAGQSSIKSISAGGAEVAPDANGNVALEKVIVVGNADQVTSGTRFTMSLRETVSDERYGLEFSTTFVRDTNGKASECQLYLINRTATPTVPSVLVRLVTHDEFTTATTDMATQTWVQQYIASLDGTNMKF